MEILLLTGLAFLAWLGWLRWKHYRREQQFAQPLPPEWLTIIQRNVPLYERLPAELKPRLHGNVQVFLRDMEFQGFHGQEIDDEVRLTIAANACMLLLNRPGQFYTNFSSIYVYPSTFISSQEDYDGVVMSISESHRLGESWMRGPVVLAWDSVRHGTVDVHDGHNVVLHEFAHKIDDMDGAVDGAPSLDDAAHYERWAEVMKREFEDHVKRVKRELPTVIDPYGATNPAEFFAVLTETFYEEPNDLNQHHPNLYAEMKRFYGLDPLRWLYRP
ncbi:MAG: M90 family metallopeptidase [Pseudomonadota bacterium]